MKKKNLKGVNRNVVAKTSHKEYKDVLLNNKCLRHSLDRIQSKDHRIGTYENKNSWLSELIIKKTSICLEKLFC